MNVDNMMDQMKGEIMTELDNEMGLNDVNMMNKLNMPEM